MTSKLMRRWHSERLRHPAQCVRRVGLCRRGSFVFLDIGELVQQATRLVGGQHRLVNEQRQKTGAEGVSDMDRRFLMLCDLHDLSSILGIQIEMVGHVELGVTR